MADWGQPRPRHQYTYMPRPFPGQKGALVYSGPLNMTAAAQGYGTGYGYGAGYGAGYGSYGMGGAYGAAYGGAYGVRHGAQYPYPYSSYSSHNNYYSNDYHCQSSYGYGRGYQNYYERYANFFYPLQPPYYTPGAITPYSANGYGYPGSTCYPTTAASTPMVQYAYVKSAATPTKLPDVYHTAQYTTRLATATAEDIALENRRVATAHGAYKPRKIKPADAEPNDLFWCREKDGQWHLRRHYDIEDNCQPGRWQMDTEIGFLVFHRD